MSIEAPADCEMIFVPWGRWWRYDFFSRSRLSSRSCAAVNTLPQVLHRQLVEAALNAFDSLFDWDWLERTARTSSPPQSEHWRFVTLKCSQRI
jgi:hypothetical protein